MERSAARRNGCLLYIHHHHSPNGTLRSSQRRPVTSALPSGNFLLLLCAYATINQLGFTTPGSSTDILLSIVLILLTGGLFVYFVFSLLRFLREEYYDIIRRISANSIKMVDLNVKDTPKRQVPPTIQFAAPVGEQALDSEAKSDVSGADVSNE